MQLPYESGWDEEYGGLFYFLDVDGHCPTQVCIQTQASSLHFEFHIMVKYLKDVRFDFCLCEQLEWSMKLWWPHSEALVAFLMAYSQTKQPKLLERFFKVYEYTFSHVSMALWI